MWHDGMCSLRLLSYYVCVMWMGVSKVCSSLCSSYPYGSRLSPAPTGRKVVVGCSSLPNQGTTCHAEVCCHSLHCDGRVSWCIGVQFWVVGLGRFGRRRGEMSKESGKRMVDVC